MNRKQTLIIGALAAAALATTAVYADHRESGDRNEKAALAQAKISLSQAIAAADQHANGKAAKAELEDENGKLVYGVEVVGDGKSTDVKVDINTGQIVSAQADGSDHERGEHEHEGRERR